MRKRGADCRLRWDSQHPADQRRYDEEGHANSERPEQSLPLRCVSILAEFAICHARYVYEGAEQNQLGETQRETHWVTTSVLRFASPPFNYPALQRACEGVPQRAWMGLLSMATVAHAEPYLDSFLPASVLSL